MRGRYAAGLATVNGRGCHGAPARTYHEPARVLVPARVVMRVVTHIYQHQGQILALCRLLGEPGRGGTDFPLD